MGSYYSLPNTRKYGWKRDHYDHRDHVHEFNCINNGKSIDLTENINIDIYNQLALGSCTGNGIAYCYEYDEYKQKGKNLFHPSRLFIYYNEREMEGNVNSDAGAEIRDGIKSIHNIGVCSEDDWPYDISKFTEKPPQKCYEFAKDHQTLQYKRVQQTVEQLNECLHNGFPIVFGFLVYESFQTPDVANTGKVPMPLENEQVLGGHCVVIVGIDHDNNTFKVRNSWGSEWGDNGYCYFPFEFITNSDYCSDFWTVQKIKNDIKFDIIDNQSVTTNNISKPTILRNSYSIDEDMDFDTSEFSDLSDSELDVKENDKKINFFFNEIEEKNTPTQLVTPDKCLKSKKLIQNVENLKNDVKQFHKLYSSQITSSPLLPKKNNWFSTTPIVNKLTYNNDFEKKVGIYNKTSLKNNIFSSSTFLNQHRPLKSLSKNKLPDFSKPEESIKLKLPALKKNKHELSAFSKPEVSIKPKLPAFSKPFVFNKSLPTFKKNTSSKCDESKLPTFDIPKFKFGDCTFNEHSFDNFNFGDDKFNKKED